MDMYYFYALRVANVVAMATMATTYMANVVNKFQKSEEIGHSISHFYNIDHIWTKLVSMCMSSTIPQLKTAILHNIGLICLLWQPYIELIL